MAALPPYGVTIDLNAPYKEPLPVLRYGKEHGALHRSAAAPGCSAVKCLLSYLIQKKHLFSFGKNENERK